MKTQTNHGSEIEIEGIPVEAVARAAPGSAWQPIATAPKDGAMIDLWVGGEFAGRHVNCYWGKPDHSCGEMGRYCDSDWHRLKPGWVDGETWGEMLHRKPTHWMPLPGPPSDGIEPDADLESLVQCPHCGSDLSWSEDRGAHCDGCDDFDPESDMPNSQLNEQPGS